MNRRDGLQALGQPEANPVSPAHAPSSQPSGQPVGTPLEHAVRQRPAIFVFHGRMIGPAGGGIVQKLAEMASVSGGVAGPVEFAARPGRRGRDGQRP